MDRLTLALETADRALRTFEEVVGRDLDDAIVRDAAIQRFEYSFEAVTKAAKRYLGAHEGVQATTPKGTVRAAFAAGHLDEKQATLALHMVDDRNMTVHTYNEDIAMQLAARLAAHAALLRAWLGAMA